MKHYILIFLSIGGFSTFAQKTRTFEYKSQHHYERLELDSNGKFALTVIQHPSINTTIAGNWQKRADSLILDSYPQRDKILVLESRRRNVKTNFRVLDKKGMPFHFSIIIVTSKSDTLEFRDQWELLKVKVHDKVTSFYIRDSNGLCSPYYKVDGSKVNDFTIYFERTRVFENEVWFFKNDGVVPLGIDGKLQNYILQSK